MFRVGPEPGVPIPKGSLLICWNCEEIIAKINCEVQVDVLCRNWTALYYSHFEWAIRHHDLTITSYCSFCNKSFLDPSKRVKYFPRDNLMGRIWSFLEEERIMI